ncbi:MAG: PTS IIA-like nitrogen regulatory protein PtsN [Pseudomonadota bacterium]
MDSILVRERVFAHCAVDSKKQLLEIISSKADRFLGLDPREVLEALMDRERLGSTGLGNGIAIPHAKLANVTTVTGLFVRLSTPVDYDAVDDRPVDLVCALFAPDTAGSEHLKALSRIARALRQGEVTDTIRSASSSDEIFEALVVAEQQSQAA